MAYRLIQVGTGGMGASWCARFLPPVVATGRLEIVAAVDLNPAVLINAQRALGLPPERCYTDVETAFAAVPADLCTVVVPPAAHEDVVGAALEHGLHVLSEKPIADTLSGAVRIADAVAASRTKMAVTMSHRFNPWHTTLRRAARSGQAGTVDYLVGRFTAEYRTRGTWGEFRFDMPDPALIDGAVHHLDILAELAGSTCESVYAESWNPSWSDFAGDPQALVTLRYANGVRATYETGLANAVGLDRWGHEYVRVEGERATLVLRSDEVMELPYDPARASPERAEADGQPLPLVQRDAWGHEWLIHQFLDWLDGGAPARTNVEANLLSLATVFAAIESARSGAAVNVPDFLAQARG